MKIHAKIAATGLFVLLTACATVSDKIEIYQRLNCSQLDQEIGKQQYRERQARIDGVVADVTTIFGDKKERDEAEFDSLISGVDEGDADVSLKALRRLKTQKRCRS